MPKINKDFIIILMGRLANAAVMLVGIKVLTALLTPVEMGNFYLFMAFYTFFVFMLISPFGQYVNRRTHAWGERESITDHLFLYFLYMMGVSLFAAGLGFLLQRFLGVAAGFESPIFISLLAGFVLFLSWNQTVVPMLNMLHHRLPFTVLTLLTSVGVIAFGVPLMVAFGSRADVWLYGTLLSNVLFSVLGLVILRKKIGERFSGFAKNFSKITKSSIKSVLAFALPLSVATLFMWLQNSGYRIIIESQIGLSFLGFFGVGMAVSGQIAAIFESVLMQHFHPIYYKQITTADSTGRKEAIDGLVTTVLPIYFMLALFLSFLAPHVLKILVAPQYHGAYIFTVFGIWVEFFRMSANLFGNISQSEMNTKRFMLPYVIGSLVTVAGVYLSGMSKNVNLFLPLALVLGAFLTAVLMWIFMRSLISFRVNFKALLVSLFVSFPYLLAPVLATKVPEVALKPYGITLVFGLYFLGTLAFIHSKFSHDHR